MTEAEWLSNRSPESLVTFVRTATTSQRTRWHGWRDARRFSVSERKWRLIAAGAARSVAALFPVDWQSQTLGPLDAWAEERGSLNDVYQATAGVVLRTDGHLHLESSIWVASLGSEDHLHLTFRGLRLLRAKLDGEPCEDPDDGSVAEAARQADLGRCILGNPFRSVHLEPHWLAAHDAAARQIAQAIYDGHAFGEMGVLADALQDAGCADDDVLTHCRAAGPHGRGCWVIDLMLGQQ